MKRYGVRPSVRPSVCPVRPLQYHAAGLLLTGDIDRLLRGAQQHGGEQQLVRAVPRFQRT